MGLTVNGAPTTTYTTAGTNSSGKVDKPPQTGKGNVDGTTGEIPDVRGSQTGGTTGTDPTDGMTQQETESFTNSVAAAMANWGQVVTDDPNSIFATMVQAQAQISQQNRNDMVNAGEAAKNAALEAANKTKKSGEQLQSSALTSMIISVAVGVAGAALAGLSLKGLASAGKTAATGAKATQGAADAGKKSAASAENFAKSSKNLSGKELKVANRQQNADQRAIRAEQSGFEAQATSQNQVFMQQSGRVQAQQQFGNAAVGAGQAVAGYTSTSGQADAKITEAEGQGYQAAAETYRTNQNLRQGTADSAQKMIDVIIEALKNKAQNAVDRMGANTKV